jgi:hypothetical protein
MEMRPNEPTLMAATLIMEHWNIILMTLDEKPHRVARPIIDALMEQLRPQSPPNPLSTEQVEAELRSDCKAL